MSGLSVDAVFFDFDGVLVESLGVKKTAFASLFEPFGTDVLARAMDYYDQNEGISRVIKIGHCYHAFVGRDIDEAALAAECRRYTDKVEHAVIGCDWVAGAQAFVEAYAGKLRLFTASGTPEDELIRIAKARRMDHYFDRMGGSPATKAEILGARMQEYGLRPERCVMLGDALSDQRGALAVGVRFIGRTVAGKAFSFPPGTETLSDLTGLADRLAA